MYQLSKPIEISFGKIKTVGPNCFLVDIYSNTGKFQHFIFELPEICKSSIQNNTISVGLNESLIPFNGFIERIKEYIMSIKEKIKNPNLKLGDIQTPIEHEMTNFMFDECEIHGENVIETKFYKANKEQNPLELPKEFYLQKVIIKSNIYIDNNNVSIICKIISAEVNLVNEKKKQRKHPDQDVIDQTILLHKRSRHSKSK